MSLTEKQEKRVRNVIAITEIQMLMGKMVTYLDRMDAESIHGKLFAKDHPEVSVEYEESGVYKGPDHVRTFFENFHAYLQDPADKRGWMNFQDLSTPYIILSGDETRAKGSWYVFGPHAKQAMPYPAETRTLTAIWYCGKYMADFIEVDGQWKILKLQLVTYIRTPYDQGWLKCPDCLRTEFMTNLRPDEPSRIHTYHPDAIYTADGTYNWGPFMPEECTF